jgi:beta-aspartyl-dipeptidase (metallo-type)
MASRYTRWWCLTHAAAAAGACVCHTAAGSPCDKKSPVFAPLLRIRGATAYYTEGHKPPLGDGVEVLIAGGKIIEISAESGSNRTQVDGPVVTDIDATGCIVLPGFVDLHMHVAGGGGEAGFKSRTPDAQLSELVDSSVTTFVGITGTDSVARSPAALLAKVKGLTEEGLSGYAWTGAYATPPPTITGSLKSDIMLISEVIGVGEIAISDHRSSNPTVDELRQIAGDARVAGMLAGKGGVTYCHMGSGKAGLAPLWDVVQTSEVPIASIMPTHMSRSQQLIDEVS